MVPSRISRPMNGSCGRMACDVEWYHDSVPGIIAAVTLASTPTPALTDLPRTPTLLTSALLARAGFAHAFPERTTTDGELGRALGIDADAAVVQVKQVHGGEAIEVFGASAADGAEGANGGPDREGDALVARAGARLVAVGMRVADCVPILVADEATGSVAAIHAGWRGVTRGIVAAAVGKLGRRGRLVAAIGPCIGPCCFEVGRDVGAQIAAAARGARVVASEQGDKVYVDLRAAVRAQLIEAGLGADRIDDVPGCTKHEAVRFHSFRRDGAESGRMLAAIATRPSA
jgi:polyphenol oxidase